jgi:hypothetical protein
MAYVCLTAASVFFFSLASSTPPIAPVFKYKELSSLRFHYQHGFVKLVKISQIKIRGGDIQGMRNGEMPSVSGNSR